VSESLRDTRDARYMAQALRLAAKGRGQTSPNPMVGALVVQQSQRGHKRIVGAGYHRKAGGPHAEILALHAAGARAKGATLYINLEPCCHLEKRTPPCVPAIIKAGIRRVVVAMRDPNPKVRGRGLARLTRAGLSVTEDVLRTQAEQLNEMYAHWMRTGRPFVLLKAAMTLDGKLATASGESRWISGEPARRYVHRLRRELDAVLIGLRTVLHDDPELTARIMIGGSRSGRRQVRYATRQPMRVILDSRLQLPPGARVLTPTAGAKTLIATTAKAPARRIEQLRARGISVLVLPAEHGRVSLRACLTQLGRLGVSSLMIEGGGEVNASAVRAQLVQRVILFVAPCLLGGQDAVGLLGGRSPKRLVEALPLTDVCVRPLGGDLMVEGRLLTS
jgi:diaminohydroxyphosphoribosylaminopyrimidine deaminase/5-amino-6-(5-phosphoribosylamino)uracil reductase